MIDSHVKVTSWSNCIMSHYNDVIMGAMASQITSLTFFYSTVYSGADQRKHQSSASLAFVRGIHRWPMNSPHKGPLSGKSFHLMTSSCIVIAWHKVSPVNILESIPNSRHVYHQSLDPFALNFVSTGMICFCGGTEAVMIMTLGYRASDSTPMANVTAEQAKTPLSWNKIVL